MVLTYMPKQTGKPIGRDYRATIRIVVQFVRFGDKKYCEPGMAVSLIASRSWGDQMIEEALISCVSAKNNVRSSGEKASGQSNAARAASATSIH
jgi:hypothetical protein